MGNRLYKSIYVDEEHAQEAHDAWCELMRQHPEWDADIDADWDESTLTCDVCGSVVNEAKIEIGLDDSTICGECKAKEGTDG